MKNILGIGIPISLQDGFIQISFIVITIIVNQRGLNDAAAVGIVEKIISFVFLVPSSMLSAVSAIAAQNIGAGKDERATKTLKYAIMISMSFGLCADAVYFKFCCGNLYSRYHGYSHGKPVYSKLHMGLHDRWNSF